jgi:putative membrane protein (TIGR04086 family)
MGIRWRIVLIGALLAELGIAALVFPVRFFVSEEAFIDSVAPACLAMTLVFGFWAGVRARTKPVLHGTLVGVVAALLYIILTIGQTLPPEFLVSHVVKVVGGLAGGGLAAWRLGRAAAPS